MKPIANTNEKLNRMPFKFVNDQTEEEIVLDIVEYIEDEDLRYFRVRNSDNVGININYVPKTISTWDKERFELYIFENPYLNAENDVFKIKEKTRDERLGWIFPITILESNENDYSDIQNLNNYKYIAYKKLLEQNVSVKTKGNNFTYTLGELFPNSVICLLSTDTISKIPNFNFKNYILSLYHYGYLKIHTTSVAKPIYDRSAFVEDMRRPDRTTITIHKANFDIYSDDFFRSLFTKDHLLQSESYLVRFVFLYQIIEHFMAREFDMQFEQYLNAYKETSLGKNDLKENIMSLSKERNLIRDIFSRITIESGVTSDFTSECEFLFNELNFIPKSNSFPDKIYDLRNVIVHRFRELINKTESMQKILEIFERAIILSLISYTEVPTDIVDN